MKNQTLAMAVSCVLLSACGGGGARGLNSLSQFQSLAANPDLQQNQIGSLTQNTVVDGAAGTANYAGFANLSADSTFYVGNLSVAVDFTNDTVGGNMNNFVEYFSVVASPTNGQSVAGSFTIAGVLNAGQNESLTDGLSGTATGTLDGTAITYDMDGNITGLDREGVILYFDDQASINGGVGLALR